MRRAISEPNCSISAAVISTGWRVSMARPVGEPSTGIDQPLLEQSLAYREIQSVDLQSLGFRVVE